MKQLKKIFVKCIILCLVFALVIPATVNAATVEPISPMASYYLDSYNTYICDMGNGRIEIWFDVMGVGNMDEIGVLSIVVSDPNDFDSTKKTFSSIKIHDLVSVVLIDPRAQIVIDEFQIPTVDGIEFKSLLTTKQPAKEVDEP